MGRIREWDMILEEFILGTFFEARLIFEDLLPEKNAVQEIMKEDAEGPGIPIYAEEDYALRDMGYEELLQMNVGDLIKRAFVRETFDNKVFEGGASEDRASEDRALKNTILGNEDFRSEDYGRIEQLFKVTDSIQRRQTDSEICYAAEELWDTQMLGAEDEAIYGTVMQMLNESSEEIFGFREDLAERESFERRKAVIEHDGALEEALGQTVRGGFWEEDGIKEAIELTAETADRISEDVSCQWIDSEKIGVVSVEKEKVRRIIENGYEISTGGDSNVKIEVVKSDGKNDTFDIEMAMDMMSQRLCDMMSRSAEGFYL